MNRVLKIIVYEFEDIICFFESCYLYLRFFGEVYDDIRKYVFFVFFLEFYGEVVWCGILLFIKVINFLKKVINDFILFF